MTLLDRLDRRFSRFAVPHVTEVFIFGQVFIYLARMGKQAPAGLDLSLIPSQVLQGEWWRLLSFLLEPPTTNVIFAFFFWYLFYLMGTALESTWGVFRYNVYLLIGYVATVAAAFVVPNQPTGAAFLQGSVFLAFAHLYPNFVLQLFFLLPVKIKWLALLTWIFYGLTILRGGWDMRLMATAAVVNFLVFFSRDIFTRARQGHRSMAWQAKAAKVSRQPRNVCRVCGKSSATDPQMSFRYCSKCAGSCCYCEEHLKNHEHVTAD